MKLLEILNETPKKVEYYAIKKPKYNKDNSEYEIISNTTMCLTTFDKNKSLENFYPLLQAKVKDIFENQVIEEYSNKENTGLNLYFDSSVTFNYDNLSAQLCSLDLLEENISLNYIIVKATFQFDDLLIWIKLKSPLKIENGVLIYDKDSYQINFRKDDITINNYPSLNFNIEDITFVKYLDDFYIVNKDLYQRYFNLESFYVKQVKDLIYNNKKLVLDEYLVTKANARMIYEHFEKIDQFILKIELNEISLADIQYLIKHLNLSLQTNENKQIILKTPQDLVDLLLLSSGCLGINSLTNEKFKVKRPNYLEIE